MGDTCEHAPGPCDTEQPRRTGTPMEIVQAPYGQHPVQGWGYVTSDSGVRAAWYYRHRGYAELSVWVGVEWPDEMRLPGRGEDWYAQDWPGTEGLTARGPSHEMDAIVVALRRWAEGRQPPPRAGEGDCWAELMAAMGADHPLHDDAGARRALGIARYGRPLQRNNGRSNVRDIHDERLDLAVYLWAGGRHRAALGLLDASWLDRLERP